jgi:phage FluMu protein Com
MDDYLFYLNQKFREKIYVDGKTNIKCPHCKKSNLILNEADLRFHETNASKENHAEEWFEIDNTIFQFSAFLLCPFCNDYTIVTGEGSYEVFHDYATDHSECYKVFHPQYFIPTIDLFEIPVKCPAEITFQIRNSFKLAWSDESAAGNKLRVAIELLLDTLVENKNSTLHNKINSLDGKYTPIKQYLLAIKWLGNDASHEASLRENDLAFAYKILEQILDYLFSDRLKLDFLASMINENKGRLGG